MSRKSHNKDDQQARERLAQLGLAADLADPGEPCPDDSRFSELLEAEPGSADQAQFFKHLSRCESCFQKWVALSDVLGESAPARSRPGSRLRRRGLLGAVGSACGLALGVMLFLSIDHRPSQYDEADLPAGPEAVQSDRRPEPSAVNKSTETDHVQQTNDAFVSGDARREERSRAKAGPPLLAEQEMAVSDKVPGGGEPARSSVPRGEHDAGADSVAELAPSVQMSRERVGSSSFGPAAGSASFLDFAGSLGDLCRAHPESVPSEDLRRPILNSGRLLLGSKPRWEGENREFVEASVRLLEKETAIDDKEWGELCEHTRRLIPQQEQGGSTSRQ